LESNHCQPNCDHREEETEQQSAIREHNNRGGLHELDSLKAIAPRNQETDLLVRRSVSF